MTDEIFWAEKPEFWKNKTDGNTLYAAQRKEVRADLFEIAKQYRAKSFADIGGYDGRIGMGKSYDIIDGFDLTKDWEKQKFKRVDICFTSLVLVAFPPAMVRHIIYQMYKNTHKGIYLFEEAFDPLKYKDGDQVSEHYGGKWAYDWSKMFPGADINVSTVNDRWVKIWKKLR